MNSLDTVFANSRRIVAASTSSRSRRTVGPGATRRTTTLQRPSATGSGRYPFWQRHGGESDFRAVAPVLRAANSFGSKHGEPEE